MKRFRFSFLALVALIAMSFTVASHQGVFEAKKKVADGCYQNITAGGLSLTLGNIDGHPGGGEGPCTNKATASYNGNKYYCVGSGQGSPTFGLVSSASGAVNPATDCTATNHGCCYEVDDNAVVRICYKD